MGVIYPMCDVVKVRGAAIGAALLFLLVVGRMVQLIRTIETNSDLFEVQARTDALPAWPTGGPSTSNSTG